MTEEAKKKSKFGKGCMIAVGVFLGLGVLGAIVGEDKAVKNPASASAQQQSDASPVAKLTGELDEARQQARYQACLKRMDAYEELRVWKHGGARPGVDLSAWELLSDDEKTEVFNIAGCIAGGGQIGERIVTVAEEGNGPEIETRRVANDRDFAASVSAK